MSNYKKFLSESQRFVAKLESAAPRIASRQPELVHFVHHSIRCHHTEIMNVTSPAALVGNLRSFCSEASNWNFPELVPAINRYVKVLDNINLDPTEEAELHSGISLLRNRFAEAADRIEVMIVSTVGSKGVPGDAKLLKVKVKPQRGLGQGIGKKVESVKVGDQVLFDKYDGSNLRIENEEFLVLKPEDFEGITEGAKRSISQIATTTNTQSNAAAGTKPPEPTLRVRLTGDKVKGRAVEKGSSCVLIVDWGLLDNTTLLDITGNELRRAREAKLEVVFVLYRGLFNVEDNRTRIATRFKDDGFETPVHFGLTAPDKLTGPGTPEVKSKLHLEIEIQGRPAVRIPVLLTVVHDLSTVPAAAPVTPERVDLDKLIAGARRSAPAAVLRINSTLIAPSADLTVLQPAQVLDTKYQPALAQLIIANQLGIIAKKMDDVAKDPVWNLLSDPLKPTPTEMPGLSEPLAMAAAAGSELHEWLAMSAGMKDILARIDALPIGSLIIVRSDGVAIPWETIYPERYRVNQSVGDATGEIDPAKFWGYRFEFETILSPGQHDLPEGDTDRIEHHRNAARMLTAVMNGDIDSERPWKAGPPVDFQRNAFTKAHGGALAEMQFKSTCSEAKMLVNMEPISGSFVYFFCHGRAGKPFDPEAAMLQIKMNPQCLIEVSDVSYDTTFTDAPIVFLNSCSSGSLASVSFDSFCARFQCKGALGLITTSFAVPTPFAARFGCALILRYMNAEGTLGELLLDMRRKALNERIPIGLFYMLRGPTDVSLKSS